MEKTLREELANTQEMDCDDCELWEYGCNLYNNPKCVSPCKKQYAHADSILSLLSQRIKAKALTDEQIDALRMSWCGRKGADQKISWRRWIALAQLQAVLGELE